MFDNATRQPSMTSRPVVPAASGTGGAWPWAILALLAATFLVLWPLLRGIVAATDDLQLLMFRYDYPSFVAALQGAWCQTLFRPLAVVSGFLTDPVTRSCRLVIPLHALGLAVGALGLDSMVKARLGAGATNRYAVLALWLLHPATSVSFWQMDTVSQTASAAAGIWLMALSLNAWRPRHRMMAWFLVTCAGLLTKETFLGWVLAGGIIGAYAGWRDHAWSERKGEIVGAAAALIFVALRLSVWDVDVMFFGKKQYSVHLGMPTVYNIALSAAGLLTYGPLHSLRLSKPTELPWIIAALGAAGHVSVLVLAGRQAWLAAARWWGIALLVLSPVLLMEHVSELYLCGPNALVALALVEASTRTSIGWRPAARVSTVVMIAVACIGHLTRAAHFDQTWSYARKLTEQVERIAVSPKMTAPEQRCSAPGVYHSVYVVSPVAALGPKVTPMLMQRRGRPLPADWLSRLDCVGLGERSSW